MIFFSRSKVTISATQFGSQEWLMYLKRYNVIFVEDLSNRSIIGEHQVGNTKLVTLPTNLKKF